MPITSIGTGWTFAATPPARATFTSEGDALRVDIPQVDTNDYDVECHFSGIRVTEGTQYRISFEAKAASDDAVHLQADAEYRGFPSIGLDTNVPLTTQWAPHSYTFTVRGLNGRPSTVPVFCLGTNAGTVWIRNVVVQEL
jgi:hypothetical protein